MSRPASQAITVDEARLWARVGVLAALALVLGYVETFIPLPVPVPGVKLGLGNIAVLVALVMLDVRSAAAVAAIKVLAAGFLFGNPLMMAYSAAGTALAFAAMALLSRIPGLSVVFVAIAGAVLHNAGQLAVAALVLGTNLVWASAPVLAIAACATGALTGVAVRYTLGVLEGERRRG
ncbi:MAG: Gx transporter family protein [Eggerthellaceae bacterium]|nr:Gx transporter family protein [Eggerthellaceae bacterium]